MIVMMQQTGEHEMSTDSGYQNTFSVVFKNCTLYVFIIYVCVCAVDVILERISSNSV